MSQPAGPDPQESIDRLLRDLRTRRGGLTDREAARRLVVSGPNQLVRRRGVRWPRQLLDQFTHPLALLLWLAAALAAVGGTGALAVAIVVVIVLNAAFAFVQEQQAEQAVEALTAYLPVTARVIRDGEEGQVDARDLVPGDVVVIAEGDRVCADARLLSGSVEVDLSTLTGESLPALRTAEPFSTHGPVLEARDLVFSGTSCTEGEATAVVFATGMHTELGRIAALSQRVGHDESPLERQVKHVARFIAIVAVGMGLAFVPLGTLVAGLPLRDAVTFAIGLLVANVPEGLLPTITLALAVGVRLLAGRGALVKRISAVETLGSTSVICTDKTGTLTLNRMRVVRAWADGRIVDLAESPSTPPTPPRPPKPPTLSTPATTAIESSVLVRLAASGAACTNAQIDSDGNEFGDATELALLHAALAVGVDLDRARGVRVRQFTFDPELRRMTTVNRIGRHGGLRLNCKGAPEDVLPLCSRLAGDQGVPTGGQGDQGVQGDAVLTAATRAALDTLVAQWATQGQRLLAIAERDLPSITDAAVAGLSRESAESDLTLLGIVAMIDPPRPEVAGAVAQCLSAGIRLIVVTGDHGLTARAIAEQVGIGSHRPLRVITGAELERLPESDLDTLLASEEELIFARSSPEAKLRIADALQHLGHVVAMTGDGVNDAPALKQADIGVAMGRSGTDVAREAATMVLTDDNFASLVSAVEAGRRVYDNVRKFIVYIFAHATPEVVPFLAYALCGGALPLPLTVMQILAIDLGTETLPALALGREPAEPGLMARPPRERGASVIDGVMLIRAWAVLGGVSAVLVLGAFLVTLVRGGWTYGADVSAGPLHEAWVLATTMSFLSIVACQIGTGLAARTQIAALTDIGVLSNRLLLLGIAVEVAFAVAVVTVPPLQAAFGTAAPPPDQWLLLLPMPVLVWGADELWRWSRRRRLRA